MRPYFRIVMKEIILKIVSRINSAEKRNLISGKVLSINRHVITFML